MLVNVQQAANILGVKKQTLRNCAMEWGLPIQTAPSHMPERDRLRKPHMRFFISDVQDLARKWAARKENEAAVLRVRASLGN